MPNQIPYGTEDFRKRNPHLFGTGTVETYQPKQASVSPLAGCSPKQSGSQKSVAVRITLIACRKRLLDDDNNTGSCKALRDAIAATLKVDDGDKRLTWECSQIKTDGEECVIVKIEML